LENFNKLLKLKTGAKKRIFTNLRVLSVHFRIKKNLKKYRSTQIEPNEYFSSGIRTHSTLSFLVILVTRIRVVMKQIDISGVEVHQVHCC
jgi:hypothetical protein